MTTNKVVLITGAGRGIGAACARLFARHGYAVCINYKTDAGAAEGIRVNAVRPGFIPK